MMQIPPICNFGVSCVIIYSDKHKLLIKIKTKTKAKNYCFGFCFLLVLVSNK